MQAKNVFTKLSPNTVTLYKEYRNQINEDAVNGNISEAKHKVKILEKMEDLSWQLAKVIEQMHSTKQ